MLQLTTSGLWQLGVVVPNVEPLQLPILIGVNNLIRQVLPGGILAHLYAGATDYSRVVGTWLRLQLEELLEQGPMGLDPLGLRLRYSMS
jgi:hypothetical protein